MVANVCALLPLLWAGLGWMPDQIKIYMRGSEDAPGAIVGNGTALAGEKYGTWNGGRVFRFYLQKGMDWERLSFRFPGESGAEGVERIELQKWKLVTLGKAGGGLERSGEGAGEYVFPDPRFDSAGVAGGMIPLGVASAEALLLAVAWLCAKRHREETWRILWPAAAAVALTLTLLMQVALPVQSYLANRSAYAFSTGELLVAAGTRFAWMGLLTAVAFGLLARYFGRWVLSLALAFGICVYLESGLLSADLPSLNGDWWFFYNTKRALWDLALWGGVTAAVLGGHAVLRKHQTGAALCLAAMAVASLLDVRRETVADKSHLAVDGFIPLEDAIRNVTYSTNRNVLVFILDSLEREQAQAILADPEEGAALRGKFRGFTEYAGNVGACPQTLTAVPNLLTGRYPGEEGSGASGYAWSCYSGDSALTAFLGNGFAAYVTTPGLGCGYTTDGSGTGSGKRRGGCVLDLKGKDGTTWSVRETSRWRWLPFGAKAGAASLVELGADASHELREWSVYPTLSRASSRMDGRNVFLFVHTEGVHVPIRYNRRGETLAGSGEGGNPYIEQGIFVMKALGDLMDAYREMGIYNRSLILVLGDHGGHGEQGNSEDVAGNRLPRRARPCLWVKPEGSTHDFETSPLPTSHAKVAVLLKAAAERRLAEGEIQEVLQSGRRVYREMALWGTGWKDWLVGRDGTFVVEEYGMSGTDGPMRRPLKRGHWYSLYWKDMRQNRADIFFDGMAARSFPVFAAGTDEVTLRVRVPEPSRKYTLKLRTGERGRGRLRFRCNAPGQEWQSWDVEPFGMVTLHGMVAGEDGMVVVVCRRDVGVREDIAFPALVLENE